MLADQVKAMADQLAAAAETIRRLEEEVDQYRRRDREIREALQRRASRLEVEAARSSPCKAHYFSKRAIDHHVFELMLDPKRSDMRSCPPGSVE